jgi:hypothetical protein
MSDVTTPTVPEPTGIPIFPLEDETLYCRDRGYDCDYETKSTAGLQRHITIKHEQRKPKPRKPRATSKPKEQENPKPKINLKVEWSEGDKLAFAKDQNGGWWVAKKLDIWP